MDDHARMVAAARRMARRIARSTELTYQQALDEVARRHGRDHWARFASDPVPVGRDVPSADAAAPTPLDTGPAPSSEPEERTGPGWWSAGSSRPRSPERRDRVRVDLAGEDWNMRPEDRPHGLEAGFLPGWNALDARFVGDGVTDADREAHVDRIAEILLPSHGLADYFVTRGRLAMAGFLLAEVDRAAREGRGASVPAMLDWHHAALREAGSVEHGMEAYLCSVLEASKGGRSHARIVLELGPLVLMSRNERSGVLGTMDAGLLPFRGAYARRANV